MKIIITLLTILFLSSCETLKYVDDLTFLSPEKGNNPNYLVMVDGKTCMDISGDIGLCAVKHQVNQPLVIEILNQPYKYTLDFRCGNADGIKFRENKDVFENIGHKFMVPIEILKENSYLNCIGDIIPDDDRKNDASNFFEIRVRLYSDKYIYPTQIFTTIYKRKKYLVLGRNAYRAKVKVINKWYNLKEQTVFRYKSKIDFAVIETKNMRRAYYGQL